VLTQQSDTVYIHDTIRVVEPTLVAEMATNKTRVYTGRAVKPDNDKVVSIVSDSITMQVPDTTDTVSVELPIIQREYEGENYRAWVSGAVDAQLDSIHVYNNTRVVTNTITATTAQASKPKHWGVGVGVGYGLTPHGLQPMVGVTLSYNLLTW
jgi:cell wall-associated NlpC family hydrolase